LIQGHRERFGNPLGEFTGKIPLPERRIVAGLEAGHGGKGQFVLDAGILDAKRGREKAVADNWAKLLLEGRALLRARPARPHLLSGERIQAANAAKFTATAVSRGPGVLEPNRSATLSNQTARSGW
jgi:hypothetical protein